MSADLVRLPPGSAAMPTETPTETPTDTAATPPRSSGKARRVDFFPDEYLMGVAGLTLEEKGAYWDVCALTYSRGAPIPDDDRENARIFRVDLRTWKRIKAKIIAKGKLRQENGCLTNKRCRAELSKAHERIDDARRNARARWASTEDRADDSPSVHRTLPEAFTQPSANHSPTVDDKSPPVSSEHNELADAPAFSSAYANHQPPTTNHQRERKSAASPLSPAKVVEERGQPDHVDSEKAAAAGNRGRRTRPAGRGGAGPAAGATAVQGTPRSNVGLLDAFDLTIRQIEMLRSKAPTVTPDRLGELFELFKASPYWRRKFESGAAIDPVAAFTAVVLSDGKPAKSSSKANGDARKVAAPRPNNLAALEGFTPSAAQLERLRGKVPHVAHKLGVLAEQFKTEPYWRQQFEAGKYADAARCFENFVLRQEGFALDRAPKAEKDKPRAVLQAGTLQARKAYDVD